MKFSIIILILGIFLSSCTSKEYKDSSTIDFKNLSGFWKIDSVVYSDNRETRYFNSGFEILNYKNDSSFNIYLNSLETLIEEGKYKIINDTIFREYENGNIMKYHITKLNGNLMEISNIYIKNPQIWEKVYYSRYNDR
jgi:hypothetical protein